MSPKVPKSYLEARRNEILAAAAKCFVEKGFHYTTMQDIYKAANLSPGAVYNYFGSKEDIVAAAVEMSQQRNVAMITEATSGKTDSALRNIGQLLISYARQSNLTTLASIDFALYSEASRNQRIHSVLSESMDIVLDKIANLVKQQQLAGTINNNLDPIAIARVLTSIFLAMEIHMILSPNFDLDSYASVYETIVDGTFSRQQKYNLRIGRSNKTGSNRKGKQE